MCHCHAYVCYIVKHIVQAHKHMEAARLLGQLATEASSSRAPPLRLKKLHVLAALEVEAFRARSLEAGDLQATLTGRPTVAGTGSGAKATKAAHTQAAQTLAGKS